MKSHKSLPSTFFILTPDVREKLLTANLTAAQWRIWCYLVSLDPFGDRGAKYLPAELMLKCKVKKSTYFAAKAKFQKLGFFDFKDGATKVINLQGHQTQSKNSDNSQQDKVIESKISESDSKISESDSKISECQSKISERQKLKTLPNNNSSPSQTIQTIQTLSDRNEREKKTTLISTTEEASHEDKNDVQVNQTALAKKKAQGDEQISPRHTTNKQQKVVWDWLPEGPWMLEGKLDPNFRDFVAQDWANRYGKTLYQCQADVLAHFKKDPANLSIRWEQYQREYLHRYQNAQTLLNREVSIDEEYQQRLIENHRAVSEPLPDELNPVAIPQRIFSIEEADRLDDWKREIPPGAENPQAYKPYVLASIVDASPETDDSVSAEQLAEGKEIIAQIRARLASKMSMPPANLTPLEKDKHSSELERLNEWIKDPILRKEVEHKLRTSDRYYVYYDEEGIPYKVSEQSF